MDRALFSDSYSTVFEGDERWRALPVPEGDTYAWDPESTYVQLPPFFAGLTPDPEPVTDITGARALAVLGDSDHHRPHLPRRQHPRQLARRALPGGARGGAARLQQLRVAPRATTR